MKEADKDIIKHLKGQGRLIDNSNYSHSYPFCWRSDTPLIQRVRSPIYAVISWLPDNMLPAALALCLASSVAAPGLIYSFSACKC